MEGRGCEAKKIGSEGSEGKGMEGEKEPLLQNKGRIPQIVGNSLWISHVLFINKTTVSVGNCSFLSIHSPLCGVCGRADAKPSLAHLSRRNQYSLNYINGRQIINDVSLGYLFIRDESLLI